MTARSILVWMMLAHLIGHSISAEPAATPGGDSGGSELEALERPSERRLPLPEYERPGPLPPLRLPPPLSPKEELRPSAGIPIFVRGYKLTGNTVFPAEVFAEITAPYVNRAIKSEELLTLRDRLTLHYVNNGYINSGAVIPDQKVADGIIHIHIIEGRLTDIAVEGNGWLRSGYISKRLALGAGPPLNVKDLQERLQILLQSPLIERINSELGPGDRLGEAVLKARVKRGIPYQLGLVVDNRLSPSIGDVRVLLQGSLSNITGWGDTLTAQGDFAEGLEDDVSVNYSLPINAYDTTFALLFDRSNANVVEDPLDVLDIESETQTIGIRLSHPFYRTPRQQFMMGLGLDRRSSKTFLGGEPRGFSVGVSEDGESDVTVIRLSQDWLSRSPSQVIAARSIFSIGIDALGATINESEDPDGRFLAWLGQFQWARRMGDTGSQLIFRTDVQLAKDPLLPLEKFAVGGAHSVRGYRQNLLVRDQGFATSLEFRIPILRDEAGQSTLQVAPFVDVGGAWEREGSTPNPKTISSVGLGLRWDPHRKLHAELYWGKALRKIEDRGDDLQDSGIHFLMSAQLF